MSREVTNWIDSYCEYTKYTESPYLFHKWTAVSVISAVLRRKTWFNFGRIKVYPNMYIVFVAEPGLARKTQAINFGEEVLSEISGIPIAADVTTPQALLDDLEEAANVSHMPDGTQLTHCSLSIFSGEFESFLGDKKDNTRMITMLTDLFDCKQRPFKTRTRHSGSNEIPHPYLNLLGATTPDSLANSLPTTAIGGGLTSRIVFISADKKRMKVPVPELDSAGERLKEKLVKDLAVMSRISGPYSYSTEGRQWWDTFYMDYEELDPKRICKDPAFRGWYSRKPMYMLKLATILTAAESNSKEIGASALASARDLIEEAERTMTRTFSAVGRSNLTADVDIVRNIIQNHKTISESQLLQMVWRDLDAKKFDIVVHTIMRSGEVTRSYVSPTGEKGIFYTWKEKTSTC